MWARAGQGPPRGLSPSVWTAVLSLGLHGAVTLLRVCVLIPCSCKDPSHMGSGLPW